MVELSLEQLPLEEEEDDFEHEQLPLDDDLQVEHDEELSLDELSHVVSLEEEEDDDLEQSQLEELSEDDFEQLHFQVDDEEHSLFKEDDDFEHSQEHFVWSQEQTDVSLHPHEHPEHCPDVASHEHWLRLHDNSVVDISFSTFKKIGQSLF